MRQWKKLGLPFLFKLKMTIAWHLVTNATYQVVHKSVWGEMTCLGVKLQVLFFNFLSLLPLGSVTASFTSIRKMHRTTFNVKQQFRGNEQVSELSKNRVLLWHMLSVNTIFPCRTVDVMNIHSQLSACQFRLPQKKTKRQALHRGPWTFSS